MAAEDQLRALEVALENTPPEQRHAIHNELRHLYSIAGNQSGALRHADAILRIAVMDPYTLRILSGWHLDEPDPSRALEELRKTAASKAFPFVRAACLVQAGLLSRNHGMAQEARRDFAAVQELQARSRQASAVLARYKALAKSRGTRGRTSASAGASSGPHPEMQCSFCAKWQSQVETLISGPSVYICNECVGACIEILSEQGHNPPQTRRQTPANPRSRKGKGPTGHGTRGARGA